jgi:iron complex outermembrane recepter protein
MRHSQIQKISLVVFIMLLSTISFSQGTYKVKGFIASVDGPVPFVSVLVKNAADSSVARVGVTDTLGIFNVSGLKNGSFFTTYKMVGYKDQNSEVFEINGADVDLKEIQLAADGELDMVTVSQIRPVIEIHPDKTVFNVDNTINATGSNGFDLLRKAPGVIIDNSNNIIVEGKSGVQVYIDNKPAILSGDDLINFLRTLQAADIDNIEIITQPSSKYDAAGGAGIINIILKRDKNLGTNGTITAGYAYGRNHHANSSISLNHRRKKLNVYTSYSNSFGKNYHFMNMERDQYGVVYDSKTESNNYTGAHNAKIGADWFINKRHTFGVLASGNYFDARGEGTTTTDITPSNIGTVDQRLIADNTGTGLNYQVAGNLNYRFADTLGHELTIDADYAQYARESNNYQPNLYLDGNGDTLFENNFRMLAPTNIQIISAKADYAQNLWGGKVSVGAKFSIVETDNTFEFYDVFDGGDVLNVDRSNNFVYTENINAAYVNYARKLKTKWNLQLGLRLEQTNSVGELTSTQSSADDYVERHYLNLFPSGGLTYTPNYKHMWAVNFSKRIQRPNYQSLNPFVNQSTELSFMKGNPFLQPAYAYNAKISHTFKYRFTTSVSYSHTQDFFAQVTDTLGLDKAFLTTMNVADQSTINLGVSLPFSIKKWWSVYLSLNGSYSQYLAQDDKFQTINQPTFSLYAQNSFLMKWGFKLELSGWFSSPSVWGGTYLTKSMGSFDAAIEKKFMKDRLALRIAGSDIFYTSPWKAEATFGDVSFIGAGGYESQRITFSLTYNFGNREAKGPRDRKTGLDDEDKRTGGN